MLKFLKNILFIVIFLNFTSAKTNSFSELFGSEGAAGIAKPKTRSLSYTLQYLSLVGASTYLVDRLYNDGFLIPFGFQPDSYANKLSPLAYGKKKISKNYNSGLEEIKDIINQRNEIMLKNKELLLKEPDLVFINKEKRILYDDFITNKNNREFLIESYLNEK